MAGSLAAVCPLLGAQGSAWLSGGARGLQRSSHARRHIPQRLQRGLYVEARDRRRRLLSLVLSAPQRAERYFNASPLRRWMWAGISVCNGFYAGNIATLSFGALAVNDVFAAVVTLLFCEVVTHLYYTDTTGSLTLWYLNCFKIGLIAALLADAVKLGS